jgi:hypothetical protein
VTLAFVALNGAPLKCRMFGLATREAQFLSRGRFDLATGCGWSQARFLRGGRLDLSTA